jgi:stress response protein YsnF
MEKNNDEIVVPVVNEELHADAIPVETGGVRVTKHVEGHDEILEQELRRGRAEVKRVKTNRVVDGPQPIQRVGNAVIVPVVSEVLHVEKQWIVTEEIHITQIEESETVQQKVRMNQERAEVERLDESGNAIASMNDDAGPRSLSGRTAAGIVGRKSSAIAASETERKVLSNQPSLVKGKPHPKKAAEEHSNTRKY